MLGFHALPRDNKDKRRSGHVGTLNKGNHQIVFVQGTNLVALTSSENTLFRVTTVSLICCSWYNVVPVVFRRSHVKMSIKCYPKIQEMLQYSSDCAVCGDSFLNTWLECVQFVDARKVKLFKVFTKPVRKGSSFLTEYRRVCRVCFFNTSPLASPTIFPCAI